MWPLMVVVHPPRFDLVPRVLDRQELIGVETLIEHAASELRAVIDRDRLRLAMLGDRPIERIRHRTS